MGAQTSKSEGILALKSGSEAKTFLQNVKISCKADILPDGVKTMIASLGLDSGDFYEVNVKYDLAVIIPTAIAAALFLILIFVLASRRRHLD